MPFITYAEFSLKKYLPCEPLNLVQRLGHSTRACKTATDKLEGEYGGKRQHIPVYLNPLESFKPLKDEDSKSFEGFADLFKTAIFTLKETGNLEELGNGMLYTMLLKILSDNQIVAYPRWIVEKELEESAQSLTTWSLRESVFCVISSETRAGFSTSSQNTYFVAEKIETSESSGSNRNSTSSVSLGSHGVAECEEFLSMGYSDRWVLRELVDSVFAALQLGTLVVNARRGCTVVYLGVNALTVDCFI